MTIRPSPAAVGAILAGMLAAGCESVGYYGQAVHGHVTLMASRQPIDALLTDPAAGSREKLASDHRGNHDRSRGVGSRLDRCEPPHHKRPFSRPNTRPE